MDKPDRQGRDEFFRTIRRALGRGPGPLPAPASDDLPTLEARAAEAVQAMETRAGELMDELADSAAEIGWTVARASSAAEAGRYVQSLARDLEASSVVSSAHPVLNDLSLEDPLAEMGVRVTVMALEQQPGEEPEAARGHLRERALAADLAITGADYAIAETGSIVLLPRRGVSRLVSLLPPAHVAVVQRGQVLPSLDELFTLRRQAHLGGDGGTYMNIISGPSRSADIEQTLVKGVHGPGNVHMVLLDRG